MAFPVEVKNTFIDYGRKNSEFTRTRRGTAPAEYLQAFTEEVASAPTLVTKTVAPAPTAGRRVSLAMTPQSSLMTASPTLMSMSAQQSIGTPAMTSQKSIGAQRASVIGTSAPTLPVTTRIRVGTGAGSNYSGSSNATPKMKEYGLSFDIPRTPESVYVGGSTGSQYSFGMPTPGTVTMQAPRVNIGPTISETAVAADFATTTTVQSKTVLPKSLSPAMGPSAEPIVVPASTRVASSTVAAPATFQQNPYAMAGYGMYNPYMQMGMGMPQADGVMPMGMPFMQMPGAYMQAPMYAAPGQAVGVNPMQLDLGSLITTQAAAPASWNSSGSTTTVMLRNIPLKYNREALLADLDARGFVCGYDFFYLPIDFHTGNCVGYAFINFIDESTVARFRSTYNGLQLSADSAKICEVSDAKAQGKLKNIEQYRNSSVMNMEDRYQPVVFENGVRTEFPPPTRSLKPVKPRARETRA